MKICGHRLEEKHFTIIRKKARQWKMKEAPTLRKMIEEFESLASQ